MFARVKYGLYQTQHYRLIYFASLFSMWQDKGTQNTLKFPFSHLIMFAAFPSDGIRTDGRKLSQPFFL
jgi:hypothetical protein